MLIINPGSEIGTFENTYEKALEYAKEHLEYIHEELGLYEIQLIEPEIKEIDEEGRADFDFYHPITGVKKQYSTDGIIDLEEYKKKYIFTPRTYWGGSSCSSPEIENWLKDGYKIKATFTK